MIGYLSVHLILLHRMLCVMSSFCEVINQISHQLIKRASGGELLQHGRRITQNYYLFRYEIANGHVLEEQR